jgi:hypothetical protein
MPDGSVLDKNDTTIQNMARDKTPGIISSVPIAAATAAYARMRLNEFVNLSDNPCFYTDTDSVILQNPLPENMVGRGLGQMKLEHIIKQGIIIAPKTYALKTKDGNLITRAKGLSIKMTWENYQALLHGETLTFNQTKFFRNMSQGTILISPTIFTQRGINIQPIGNLGLIPYVDSNLALVPYIKSKLAVIPFIKVQNTVVIYQKPQLALIIITHGSVDGGTGSIKPTYIANLPFEVRIPDPNKQALIRYYLDPNLKSIYDIIGPGLLPWSPNYDFSGWTSDTLFTILANCDIPIKENRTMCWNYLNYDTMMRSKIKAKNLKNSHTSWLLKKGRIHSND